MTNFEHYKKEIFELLNSNNVGIAISNNTMKPEECTGFDCDKCYLSTSKNGCSKALVRWLYEEYVEPPKQPKLTKKERQFCELVETGWITRGKYRELEYRNRKPKRSDMIYNKNCYFWKFDNNSGDTLYAKINMETAFPHLTFSFITWDDEPWSIEDLLKLEVE